METYTENQLYLLSLKDKVTSVCYIAFKDTCEYTKGYLVNCHSAVKEKLALNLAILLSTLWSSDIGYYNVQMIIRDHSNKDGQDSIHR